MKDPLFEGAGTALVTPFSHGEIDYAALERLIEAQYKGETAALIVCGTTGEAATLTTEEHIRLYRFCVRVSKGRMKVIAGIGSNDTAHALTLARWAQDMGADAVLMLTPYYNKTTQTGLVDHFFHVADRIDIPVIVYNVPGRTGMNISPETYLTLAQHPNINGVKEAGGDMAAFARALTLCGDDLIFWSGNDADTAAMMALGAKGVISVASNLVPHHISKLCALCLKGDFTAAAALNKKLTRLYSLLFAEVNPIPVKAAMAMLGQCEPELRAPLLPLSEELIEPMKSCLKELSLLS